MVGGGITLSTTARDLARSGFFGKDFDSIVSEIVDFLNLRFGSEVADNIVASEQGVMLIEMVAYALSTAHWYGDRQIDDTNLFNVRIRSAAAIVARQLGYKVTGAVPAAVDLVMTLDPVPTTRVTIERGRKMQGPDGLIFQTAQEIIFDIGDVGPKSFVAVQGETFEEVFTSSGSRNQFFNLVTIPNNSELAYKLNVLTVGGIGWTEQDILTYEQTDQYEILYGHAPPRLLFGDGVAGNIPLGESEIRIQFVATRGTNGSVPSDSVTTFLEPIVANGVTYTATIVQGGPSTPGAVGESISSIKSNAPLVFQSAQRAVTQLDLVGWINSFTDSVYGSVSIGTATVPRSVDQDAEALTIIQLVENCGCSPDVVTRLRDYWDSVLVTNNQPNIIVVQILAEDSIGRYISASAGLAAALETFLDGITVYTTKAHVTDGSINLLSVDTSVEIKPLPAFSGAAAQEQVKIDVIAAVEAQLVGRDYGESLRISDLYTVVEAVEGVDYAHIAITNQSTRVNSFGDLPIEEFEIITLGQTPVVTII